jgi:hypothetical protein
MRSESVELEMNRVEGGKKVFLWLVGYPQRPTNSGVYVGCGSWSLDSAKGGRDQQYA